MVENESFIGIAGQEKSKRVFENPPENAPASVISFLGLAEREGAYGALPETTRQRLEMRFLEGLSTTEIAKRQNVSKQAVSQTMKIFPKTLYRKMTEDVYFGRTLISYKEILLKYSDCMLYLKNGKKSSHPKA